MKQNTQIGVVLGVVVVLIAVVIWWSTTLNMVATSSPTVASSTQEMWASFKEKFDCEKVTVSATTTVISFTNEGSTTTAGTNDVYQCSPNGNSALVVY